MPGSIFIASSPGAIASAYRPLIFNVQSPVTAPELQVKGEIYVKPSQASPFALVAVKYERKYLGQNYFIFDLSNTMQSQVTFDRLTALQVPGIIHPNNGSAVLYKIKFTEVYYNGSGLPTEYNSVWSAEYIAVNSIPQHYEEQGLTDYIIWGAAGGDSFSQGFNNGFGS